MDGVRFGTSNSITGNNATSDSGYGYRSTGAINRIDSSSAAANSRVGILCGNDYLVRNTSFVNVGGNHSPASGSGNSGAIQAAGVSTNARANF